MDKIKGTLLGLLAIVLIIIIPVGIVNEFFTFLANACKWIVFVDNAETGLPMLAEIFVKAIIETIVIAIMVLIGVNEKNPITTILSIVLGFAACVLFYWIAKYIFLILGAMIAILVGYIVFIELRKKIKDKMVEN